MTQKIPFFCSLENDAKMATCKSTVESENCCHGREVKNALKAEYNKINFQPIQCLHRKTVNAMSLNLINYFRFLGIKIMKNLLT